MKKLFLAIFSLIVLASSADAKCYVPSQYWYNTGGGTAPKAYCWDIVKVGSSNAGWERTDTKYSTTYNHGGNLLITDVVVLGYGKTPSVKMEYRNFNLAWEQAITNPYGIVVGWYYRFYKQGSDVPQSGTAEVKEYGYYTKDSLYIR